ncbi:hypothetical protein OF83DRAFT_1048410 [Amylostereum chailletii]|nr:hypothetical protein OF83DRAFT_1048410 [Amylostereum chailletii]
MADEELVLYSQRPEWSDITPVPQYEGIQPLAPIFYTPEYKDATDYFRAVVKSGEMSRRVLGLTESIIRLNPAHYSAWQLRYRTLIAISAPLDAELKLTNDLTTDFLKTYQVWHHRRLLITALNDASEELSFVEAALKVDTKNYHTWSHRQWVLAHFNREEMWSGELPLVDRLLEEDVRNNSAWHHRFFVVFERGTETGEAVVKRELAFVKEKIALAPNNPSAWNYFRGVLDHSHTPYATEQAFVQLYTGPTPSLTFTDEVLDLENPPPSQGSQLPCTAAIDFMADIYEANGKDSLQKAVELWRSLADKHDTIRKKYVHSDITRDVYLCTTRSYWEYRIREATAA